MLRASLSFDYHDNTPSGNVILTFEHGSLVGIQPVLGENAKMSIHEATSEQLVLGGGNKAIVMMDIEEAEGEYVLVVQVQTDVKTYAKLMIPGLPSRLFSPGTVETITWPRPS